MSWSDGETMEESGLIKITGDGSPGVWFFAKNSGRNFNEIEPSFSYATSASRPERFDTSEARLPEASITRNAVFMVNLASERSSKGSNESRYRSTSPRSQAGTRFRDFAARRAAPRMTHATEGFSVTFLEPSKVRVELIADRRTRKDEADIEPELANQARWLAT